MVHKKRGTRRSAKRTTKSKRTSLVRQVKSLAKAVRRTRPEPRTADNEQAFTNVSVPLDALTGTLVFTSPTQGVGQGQRAGKELFIQNVIVSLIIMNHNTTPDGSMVRLIIVRQKRVQEIDGSNVPVLNDVLAIGDEVWSRYRRPIKGPLQVILDKKITIPMGSTNWNGTDMTVLRSLRRRTFFVGVNKKMMFNDAGTNVVDGQLFFWIIADHHLALPVFEMNLRVNWTDP